MHRKYDICNLVEHTGNACMMHLTKRCDDDRDDTLTLSAETVTIVME